MRTLDKPKGGSLRRLADEDSADGPQASEPTGEVPILVDVAPERYPQ